MSYAEKMVCSDVELAKLDADLEVAYRSAKAISKETRLARDQRRWLGIRDACRDRMCIKNAYVVRIALLRATGVAGSASAPQGSDDISRKDGVCAYLARMANHGKLANVVLKGSPLSDSSFPTPPDMESGGVTFRDLVDINNDGRPEYVYITSEGTAHFEEIAVYDSNLRPIETSTSPDDDWEADKLRWATDRRIILHEGVYYILGKTDDYLNYVSKIGADNVMKVLCQFGQEKKPLARVAVSLDDAVCGAVLHRNIEYVPFNNSHSVTIQDLRLTGLRETVPSEMAAKADINNNDRADYVIMTELASGAGRGCTTSRLALLNKARTKLVHSPLAELLTEIGGGCYGAKVLPFRFKGKTYLEHKYAESHPTNIHSIFKIKNGKRDDICKFETRVVNYVLSQHESVIQAAEENHKNPWEYAFERPDIKAVELLIKSGRDVNETISDMPLLNWAVGHHRDDLLELLLKHGADPNRKHRMLSPLFEAIWRGTDESVAILLRHGAQLNIGNTDPIMEAIRYGHVAKLRIIIKHGIRPVQRNLDRALRAANPNPEIIQVLEDAISR